MAKAKAKAKAPKAKAKARSAPKAKTKAPKAKAHPKKLAKKTSAKVHAKHAAKSSARSLVAAATYVERFDRDAYAIPLLDLTEAIALASALLESKPPKPNAVVVEELKRLTAARDRARAVKKTQGVHGPSVDGRDARAYDVAMDRAWETFVRRIQDHVELPGPRDAGTIEAVRIYTIVSDLSILKLNFLAEFAQIGARLDALKREGLLEVAARLTGPVFLDEVLRCHGEYGQALGLMPAGPEGDAILELGESRNALCEAISEYAVQVMAQARAGQHDSWAPVRKALAPIMDHRHRQAQVHRNVLTPPARPVHPPVVPVVVVERAESAEQTS